MEKYDIFISYRRDGGGEVARLLKSELEKRQFKVFLDFDELKDGVFNQRIMDAIESAPIFLVVLSPNSLDKCVNEDDWVRAEIEYAIKKNRHFVPINPDGTFTGFPDEIPDFIKQGLGQHQFSDIMLGQLFNASIEQMIKNRIKPILGETPHEWYVGEVGAIIHVETDADCRILKFGKEIGVAYAGEDREIRLRKGKYKLNFVSLKNSKVSHSMVYRVEDNEMEDFLSVELCPALEKWNQIISDMILVEGDTFLMGSNNGNVDENPVPSVTLADYYIGKYPVTQKLWTEVMGNKPSYFEGDDLPVERVNWFDCISFCNALSRRNGLEECYHIDGDLVTLVSGRHGYRLPTEAEWEFAARGGRKSKGFRYAGSDSLDGVAWCLENSGGKTHPVGQKHANELGLFDISGNVWEWCWDWYKGPYSSNQSNPLEAVSGNFRVYRGGSWSRSACCCRATNRNYCTPTYSSTDLGFRLVFVP